MDVNEELKVFVKIKKKNGGEGGGGRSWVGGVGLGGVRVDVKEELKFLGKFTKKSGGGREGESGRVGGGQGVCERRIEVFGKFHTKKSGGGGR